MKSLRTNMTLDGLRDFYDDSARMTTSEQLRAMYTVGAQARRVWAILEGLKNRLAGGERVLDVGCADGYLTAQVADMLPTGEIDAVEISEVLLSHAPAKDNVTWFCAPIEAFLQIAPPGHYDLVLAAEVLEHLLDPWTVMKQLRAISAYVLVSVPVNERPNIDAFNLGRKKHPRQPGDATGHIHHFRLPDLHALFERVDYEWTDGARAVMGGW
jgi:SAM-dependent methyltransferase